VLSESEEEILNESEETSEEDPTEDLPVETVKDETYILQDVTSAVC
jgi:hypothetical protein